MEPTGLMPLYAVLGIAIMGTGGLIRKICSRERIFHDKKAYGYVLENKVSETRTGKKYHPLITYEIDGTHYTVQYKNGTKGIEYEPGKTIAIRVNPCDPSDIVIPSEKTKLCDMLGIALFSIGAVIAAASTAMIAVAFSN